MEKKRSTNILLDKGNNDAACERKKYNNRYSKRDSNHIGSYWTFWNKCSD